LIRLKGLSWGTIGVEFVIVFVGIFGALQVDEWNEERELREQERLYLERLADELRNTEEGLEGSLEFQRFMYEGVDAAYRSLEEGRIGADSLLVERGLVYVGHLPTPQIPKATFNEMVGSGAFARVPNQSLKLAISEVYVRHESLVQNFAWWRTSVLQFDHDVLSDYLEYYPGQESGALTQSHRARYDFDELLRDHRVRNGLYWARDTHDDWVGFIGGLLRRTTAAREMIEQELAGRDGGA
jgi:hypothetical protein